MGLLVDGEWQTTWYVRDFSVQLRVQNLAVSISSKTAV